MEVPVSV